VALEGEGDAVVDANGGEETPAIEQAGLAGREAHSFDGKDAVIVEDEMMNHEWPPTGRIF
jgi:hypothetical protein